MQKVMEDVIMYCESFEGHYDNVRTFLVHCKKNNILLKKDKLEFTKNEVYFAWYSINSVGVSADKKKIRELFEFPSPKSITELKLFFGLANQDGVILQKKTQ